MQSADLAKLLVESPPEARNSLILKHEPFDPVAIAESLQTTCYEVWTEDPKAVYEIADTLNLIADRTQNAEVQAYSEWVNAIQALVRGELEDCVDFIESSEAIFANLGKTHLAAKTQTSKLYALALLGRYDEAVECGKRALKVFNQHRDIYSAGKIEHNIGNLFARRDMYVEAEPFFESAYENFKAVDDQRQLASVENCLAFVKLLQNKYYEAEQIYKSALSRADRIDLLVTEAEIEIGLSNLYLFQGRYDSALKYIERARKKYDSLAMPAQSANCEMEIADIYLELNLLPEAIGFYERASATFKEFGIQAELARCIVNHVRALMRLGRFQEVGAMLDTAEELNIREGNKMAIASVQFARAQMYIAKEEWDKALNEARAASESFESGGNERLALTANWLRGEAFLRQGDTARAIAILEKTLVVSSERFPQITYLCHVSLGKAAGEEGHFIDAIDLVENSRAMLSSDEMRSAFFANRMVPYEELVKLSLSRGKYAEAFGWHERSRSRSLLDMVEGKLVDKTENDQLRRLRNELNWYHNRLNRNDRSGLVADGETETLRGIAKAKEAEYAEALRRSNAGDPLNAYVTSVADPRSSQTYLHDATLVEFAIIDGAVTAFVINEGGFHVVENYCREEDIEHAVKQLLFQIKSSRMSQYLSDRNREIATARMIAHARSIYDILLRPLEKHFSGNRLIFAPAKCLHQLPFNVLHDGTGYLIERFTLSYTPSLSVLARCCEREQNEREKILLVGVADHLTPHVVDEMSEIGALFDSKKMLLDEAASIDNIQRFAVDADIIHLACHGSFRQDNPGFSSVTLFNENLTMNDVAGIDLTNRTVVLSACETGLSHVIDGEELVGLTRGFYAAGVSELVLSLWTADDAATLELMKLFYTAIKKGRRIADALRDAQLEMIATEKPPYLWAPFLISGRF